MLLREQPECCVPAPVAAVRRVDFGSRRAVDLASERVVLRRCVEGRHDWRTWAACSRTQACSQSGRAGLARSCHAARAAAFLRLPVTWAACRACDGVLGSARQAGWRPFMVAPWGVARAG